MNVIYLLQYAAFFCWSIVTIFVIIGVIAQIYRPKRSGHKAKNVEFIIVSIADRKVEKALFKCITHTKEKLNCFLWLLVDEGSELIPKLKENSLIIVPKSYRRDLIGKGRAMNYFVENKVQSGKWYAFIDDDNLILDDKFLYEIPYYEERGYVGMNPILVPRKGNSTFTYIIDFIRYFDDLSLFRFFTGLLKRPLIGFHGELLTVKGEVLKEIGFNHPTLVEDFRFASEFVRRRYKCWQSDSKVSILSPNSLGDLMKQRGRWFIGILKDCKYCPFLIREIVYMRLIVWMLGIIGSWALCFLWVLWDPFYFAIPGGLYYWAAYTYGVMKSRKPHYFFLIPLFGIFEAGSFFAGLRQKEFVVIDKN